MKALRILSIAEKLFKTIMILTVVTLFFLVGMFIHSIFYPQAYDKVTLSIHNGYTIEYKGTVAQAPESYAEYMKGNREQFYYSKLTLGSKIIIFMILMIKLGLILLIIKNMICFFKSVKDYSTFFVNNSRYFKRIGLIFCTKLIFDLVFIFLRREMTMIFPDGQVTDISHGIYIRMDSLGLTCVFIVLCFVASMVFKEGENLRIENELTI